MALPVVMRRFVRGRQGNLARRGEDAGSYPEADFARARRGVAHSIGAWPPTSGAGLSASAI
jgi:hypothetical protein